MMQLFSGKSVTPEFGIALMKLRSENRPLDLKTGQEGHITLPGFHWLVLFGNWKTRKLDVYTLERGAFCVFKDQYLVLSWYLQLDVSA